MIHEIKSRVNDWLPVMYYFGVPELPTRKEGPCFVCGGKDRARWITDKQYYFCNQCAQRGRDGISVIKEYNNWTMFETLKQLEGYLGISNKPLDRKLLAKHNKKKADDKLKYYLQIHYCACGSRRQLTGADVKLWDEAINYMRWYAKAYPNAGGLNVVW